jgi:hypothetical protein
MKGVVPAAVWVMGCCMQQRVKGEVYQKIA